MKQTIYLDVLICLNLFINYFILLSTINILHMKVSRKRLMLASSLGAFYSLYIFLPKVNFSISLLIKLIMAASIVFVAFCPKSLKVFSKTFFLFYLISFAFGGIAFFVWHYMSPKGLFVNNSIVYLDFPPLFLLISTFIAYTIIKLSNVLFVSQDFTSSTYEILIEYNKKIAVIKAKVDTGNTLKEPFSGNPVIVTDYKFIKYIIPAELANYFNKNTETESLKKLKNFRFIPYNTISGNGLLPAFKPDKIKVLNSNSINKDAYVAICNNKFSNESYHALISIDLIN